MTRFAYGGQALLEGVLMRGRDAIGVAVRGPDGRIFVAQEPLASLLHRNRFARAPFFRGLIVLYETLVVGTRWLMRSGSIAAASEGVAMGGATLAITLLLTLGLAIGLFVLLPLFLAQATTNAAIPGGQAFIQHLVEGLIRVGIFVGYLLVVSRSAEIRRVFQYHGAEHMTIHALENEDPLTLERVRRYPTAHPRCGTEFLVVFIIVSILIFSLLAGQDLLISIVGRILLIPVIASVSYEILRWGAKHREHWWIRWLFLPGIWLQAITTKQPDDSMIEVAIASIHEALAANGDTAPEGSDDPVREPIPDLKALADDRAQAIDSPESVDQSPRAIDQSPQGAPPADPAAR
ncbi:MAG: DUF1385 domain-containing protein [Chloroflexi bacterium]|nr:DUF1385 domain-containing protein [Chloroflexota bacterium]HEV8054419.1 DUF1385 domain-containing protein [Candidatus Limnocylindrales bacterium]